MALKQAHEAGMRVPHSEVVPQVASCFEEYTSAMMSAMTRQTACVSIVGGKERRTSCTPPTACLALSSALIAPCVEVAGTVQ
jgi:hypothetical protein